MTDSNARPPMPAMTGRRGAVAPEGSDVAAALKDELGEVILQPIFRAAEARGLKGDGLVAHVLSALLSSPTWFQNLLAIFGAGTVDHVFGKYLGGDAAARSTLRAIAHGTLRAAPLAAFRALADIKVDDEREAALRKQIAELSKDGSVADNTPKDAAAAKATVKEVKYSPVALAFVAAFGRSVDVSEADDANEIFEARPDLVERMAREWFLDGIDETPKYGEDGQLDGEQERKLKAHRELTDDQKAGVIRTLFATGAARPDQNPVLKNLLDRLSGKKAEKADDPKVAAVAAAEKKLAEAKGPLDESTARAELATAKQALEPHHNPWPRRIGVGLAAVVAIIVIALAVAHATNSEALIAP